MANQNYSIVDYTDTTKGVGFENSHVSLYFTFHKNSTPVWVTNPTFVLKKNGVAVSNLYLLRDIERSTREEEGVARTGEYIVTFLTNDLTEGAYTAEASGTHDSSPITVSGTFTLKAAVREQWFIDSLKTALGETRALFVPEQYLLMDPSKHFWEDGKLWQFLDLAVHDINSMPPLISSVFTLKDVPCASYVLLGGQLYALASIGCFEIGNFFDVGVPMRVNLYKGDKYQSFANYLRTNYVEMIKKWKAYYTFNITRVSFYTTTRIPYRILRPVSMTLHFHSLFPY